MAKKASKKAPAKVAPKKGMAPKPKAEKGSSVKFTSFLFGATIPTQPFGNVQPCITVEAGSYEDAAAFAIPKIEELYTKYAENKPVVFGRVTEEEKIVTPAPAPAPVAAPVPAPAPKAAETSPSSAPAPEAAPAPAATPVPKHEATAKAEKAISLARTDEAAKKIKEQIEKSVKIPEADKPALITLVDAKILDLETDIF